MSLETKALKDRARWIAYCIEIGFATKEQIPKLEVLWDKFKDKKGRLIKEPVNTDLFSESKLHETFDGPEITEGTQPSIKLTFYSGKLWHSDKPFPEHMVGDQSKKPVPGARKWKKQAEEQKQWLSTAYEVVNPEVIPGIRKARKLVKLNPCYGFENLNDGDQITLPEGYWIKMEAKHCCCDIDGHGTKNAKGESVCFECKSCLEIALPSEKHIRIIKKPVVEPSESQEEPLSRSIQRDLRAFIPKMVSGELDDKLKLGYVQLINGKRVELILKIEVS